jgi:hypothetical protein
MSTDTFWQIIVRPFFMVALLFTAFAVAAVLRRHIPEGRLKSALYKPYSLIGPAESPRVMWIARGIAVLVVVLIVFKPLSLLR